MQRSGSTFAFNIAREILSKEGTSTSLENLEDAVVHTEHKNLLLKSHTPDELTSKLIKLGGVKCICTFRKPEDAISSWMNTFGFTLEQSVEYMKQWIEWHMTIKHAVLNIPYEKIEKSPLRAIFDMQTYLTGHLNIASSLKLRFKYDKRRLRNIYQSLPEGEKTESVGFSYYDKETFFHRNHISQTAHKLTEEEAKAVRTAFREFSDAHGNYIV